MDLTEILVELILERLKKMNSSVYKVGLYCRLSLDDGSSNESGSITTQKMMLDSTVKITT